MLLSESMNLLSGNDIHEQTKILMGPVVVFVFCQCFTIVADVYELICALGNSKSYNTSCPSNPGLLNVNNFISWGHFMLTVNASVNFIFYTIYIKEFREAFLKVTVVILKLITTLIVIIII